MTEPTNSDNAGRPPKVPTRLSPADLTQARVLARDLEHAAAMHIFPMAILDAGDVIKALGFAIRDCAPVKESDRPILDEARRLLISMMKSLRLTERRAKEDKIETTMMRLGDDGDIEEETEYLPNYPYVAKRWEAFQSDCMTLIRKIERLTGCKRWNAETKMRPWPPPPRPPFRFNRPP